MNLSRLSFDAMPPFAVPFRFFVTAPVFIIAVGLLLLIANEEELTSRWSSTMLAATHGITLGFMLMVMLGALFQVLPVAVGVAIPSARKTALIVHSFLVIGVTGLTGGLYFKLNEALLIATISLFISLAYFLTKVFQGFSGMRKTVTSVAIRLAIISLLITVLLGLLLTLSWVDPSLVPAFRLWTNTHLLWGVVGWVLLLIMGVSFQIVPMFYVTPDYPDWLSRYLPLAIFIQLLIYSLLQTLIYHSTITGSTFNFIDTHIITIIKYETLQNLLTLSLIISALIFPTYTLHLLSRRKRKVHDTTIWFWNTAMSNFIFAASIFLLLIVDDPLLLMIDNSQLSTQLEILAGVSLLVGVVMTLITGMLLKIVPFLVWLNLQQRWIKTPEKKMPLSNMQQVIPVKTTRRLYYLYLPMLLLLYALAAGFHSEWLLKITALFIIVFFSYLLLCLIKARILYNKLASRLTRHEH